MSKDNKKKEEKPVKPVITTQSVRENLSHQGTQTKNKKKD